VFKCRISHITCVVGHLRLAQGSFRTHRHKACSDRLNIITQNKRRRRKNKYKVTVETIREVYKKYTLWG